MTGKIERTKKKLLQEILNNKISGSSYIVDKIEKLFSISSKQEIINFSKKILSVHHSMASILNTINFYLLKKIDGINVKKPEIDNSQIKNFWKNSDNINSFVTISNSKWVIEFLKSSPHKLNIYVAISHPEKEGVKTKNELQNLHNVSLIEDGAMCGIVKRCDAVVFGADLVTKSYIVNKIGSLTLAICSNYFKKRVISVTSGDKYLTDELLNIYKNLNYKNNNPLFEKVPLKLIEELIIVSPKINFKTSFYLKKIIDFSSYK